MNLVIRCCIYSNPVSLNVIATILIVFRFRPSQFTVKLGEWDLKDSDIYSQEFRIVEITAHPDFKANGFYNDVTIFKLDQPAYFNE